MKGWKTITIAVLIALTGFFEQLKGIIPENAVGTILMVIGLVVGVLRYFTATPIGKK